MRDRIQIFDPVVAWGFVPVMHIQITRVFARVPHPDQTVAEVRHAIDFDLVVALRGLGPSRFADLGPIVGRDPANEYAIFAVIEQLAKILLRR